MSLLKSLLSPLFFGFASFFAMWHLGPSVANSDLQSGVPWLFWSILLGRICVGNAPLQDSLYAGYGDAAESRTGSGAASTGKKRRLRDGSEV